MFKIRISESFRLDKSQLELDFVDIDTEKDLPLFLDPYFLSIRNDQWSISASRTIKSFFQHIVNLLINNEINSAKLLFEPLSEPNETCLGLSEKKPMGKGVGEYDAIKIFDSILSSKAIEKGIVRNIEDCVIFVDGIRNDKISDMTTNIIRKHLIEYTKQQCRLFQIPLVSNVPSGMYWDRQLNCWNNSMEEMLIVDERKILLVPKSVVSFCNDYTPSKYSQHFVLNFLQNEHLRLNTSLVQRYTNKKGKERIFVTKKSIKEKEGTLNKEFLRSFTDKHPHVFKEFKEKTKDYIRSIENENFGEIKLDIVIDYLIQKLKEIPSGAEYATQYHRLIVGIMDLIFYPNLTCPQIEQEIHDGRKRIDITFDNSAFDGIFVKLQEKFKMPCQYIFMECKNYTNDIKNAELDQLAGRFSPNRGRVGFLVCRKIDDMNLFLSRCHDTYYDDRGLIIPIVDDDINFILDKMRNKEIHPEEDFFNERLRKIILK